MELKRWKEWYVIAGVTLLVAMLAALCAVQGMLAWRAYQAAYDERAEYSKDAQDYAGNVEWAAKIAEGGYILHFRHGEREKWNDVTAFDAMELALGLDASEESFARATCLTERGVEEAKLLGTVFDMNGVEFTEVVSSPSCRARQTAFHAFGEEGRIANSLLHRTAVRENQKREFAEALRAELDALEVPSDSNVALSGHGGTLDTDGDIVIDRNDIGRLDGRNEGGFVVLEKVDGEIVARHVFRSPWEYVNATVALPAASVQAAN